MSRRPAFADMQAAAEQRLGYKLPADRIPYFWEFSEEGTALCVLQHYPEEEGGFAHPDLREQVSLKRCYVGDDDIASFLSPYWRTRIEGLALGELQRERRKQECQDFDAAAAEEAETEVYP